MSYNFKKESKNDKAEIFLLYVLSVFFTKVLNFNLVTWLNQFKKIIICILIIFQISEFNHNLNVVFINENLKVSTVTFTTMHLIR